jgi:hypothetical protein
MITDWQFQITMHNTRRSKDVLNDDWLLSVFCNCKWSFDGPTDTVLLNETEHEDLPQHEGLRFNNPIPRISITVQVHIGARLAT